ncbi:Uncharacterised protein [Vibrio cholerae]|nr:Uncharacterised protein [Vibrio cholerae]
MRKSALLCPWRRAAGSHSRAKLPAINACGLNGTIGYWVVKCSTKRRPESSLSRFSSPAKQ